MTTYSSVGSEAFFYALWLHESSNSIPWYHGQLTREEAESLFDTQIDGLFLVRDSISYQGDFSLMVYHQKKILNYRIFCYEDSLTIDNETFFNTLDDLINYYRTNTENSMLKTKLGDYIIKTKKSDLIPWHFIKIQKIGYGDFGKILFANYSNRKLMLSEIKHVREMRQLLDRNVCHENLMNILGLTCYNGIFYAISIHSKDGNLQDILRNCNVKKLSVENTKGFVYDICSAMEYLERMRVRHKFLATRNVLITNRGIAKLMNFGLYDELSENVKELAVRWRAPETITNNEHTHKSDVWSFGICLWEIYTNGKMPYEKFCYTEVHKNIQCGFRLDIPVTCPKDHVDIIRSCWKWSPKKRPSFYEIKKTLLEKRELKYALEFITTI